MGCVAGFTKQLYFTLRINFVYTTQNIDETRKVKRNERN